MATTTLDYSVIFKEMDCDIILLSETTVRLYKDEAIQDAERIVADMASDLQRWAQLVVDKQITTAEFEWLVNSEKPSMVFKFKSLEKAGLASIRIEQYAASLLNLIADVLLRYISASLWKAETSI